MRKHSKIDFFVVGEESPDLEIILGKLSALPKGSSKGIVQHNDDWLRLDRSEVGPNGFYGDMMRISMAPPGFRASLEGETEPIFFNSDEGLAESSAFYFDYESRLLLLQRNAKAVTSGQLAHYFKQIAESDLDVVLTPVYRPTGMVKVKTLTQIRKIHISANIIDVMPTIEDIDVNTKSLIINSLAAESPSLEIVLKSGREKEGTLNHAVAQETIASWLKIHDNYGDEENEIVRKIVVSGKDDTGESIEFDLLKDRIFVKVDYEWVPNHDELWDIRRQKLQQAWDLQHVNLKRILASRE